MAVYVVHGNKRKKFRTARGAAWHKRRFGGRIVKGNPKRKAHRRHAKRRKSTKRRR